MPVIPSSSSLPLFPLQCLSSLRLPSCLRPSLSLPSPPSNSPPFSPLPHSSIQSPPPPMFQVSSDIRIEWVHIKTSTFLGARTGYCCIHRVKQTIVHDAYDFYRSVHQITYGDIIKAFCKKKKPPCKGHLRIMDTIARPKGVCYSEVSLYYIVIHTLYT